MRWSFHFRRLHSSRLSSPRIEPISETLFANPHPFLAKKAPTEKRNSGNKKSVTADPEVVKWNMKITAYMRNGQCDSALLIFNNMPNRSPVSYNAMISGYLSNGDYENARQMFEKMPERDSISWNIMLSGHSRYRNLSAARKLFDQMPERDVWSWNAILCGYAQNGCTEEARQIFEEMPCKNHISWHGLLASYVHSERMEEARRLFFESKFDWDVVSWNCLMGGYVKKKRLNEARQIFERMPLRDNISWNTMITCYAQNGEILEARRLFEESPTRDVFAWTAMVSGYVQNGMLDEARRFFDQIPEKNNVSWTAMIAGYVQSQRMDVARELFDAMPCRNVTSWNTMISGYTQSGDIAQARTLFDKMPQRNCVSWAAIIAGYAQSSHWEEALNCFIMMKRDGVRLNSFAFTCALSSSADLAALELGRQLHGGLVKAGYESACFVGNALLAMYCKCGSIEDAFYVFQSIAEKNVVSWNTIIAGYARYGFGKEALVLFESMKNEGVKPDDVTMVGVLTACSHTGLVDKGMEYFKMMKQDGVILNSFAFACALSFSADLAALELGRQLHGRLVKAGYESACFVGTALLGMYCKCGSIEDAFSVFQSIAEKNVDSWNTIIAGYARHGFGKEALVVFESMKNEGVKPDDVTMVGVLTACSHAGLVDKGMEYFNLMNQEYGVTANSKHYTCMVDLLGRAGRLDAAQNLMKTMPFQPEGNTWRALLGACRIHGNINLGEKAAKMIFKMEPDKSGMYVLLSNLYAASGRWSDVQKMRVKMKDKGVKKVPGHSWIEVDNKIHTFIVGDSFHPEKGRIYAYLDELVLKLKTKGYISSTKLVLCDVEEEEKENMLKYHSEKLAVAYGILRIPSGRPIRVIKNLRVCEDCHTAIKHISKIANRLIILRDSNRFHHFKDGSCSCGDYW